MPELALSARGLGVMHGKRCILREVDFHAAHGEVVAVLGPNGAGKSTLLRAICALLPFTGSVQIDGAELASLTPRQRAQRLAFVPQQSGLRAALPVRDVVAQGRYAHKQAFGALGRADHEAIDRALATTDTLSFAERPFTALSHGEQRRVLLARGLCTGARVLLLDEPTAALDVQHALQLYALLRTLAAQGTAVVVVLHQLDDALRFSDRSLLLSAGSVVRCDATREVITSAHVRDVYNVEMRHGAAPGFYLEEAAP